ncbi:MAG: prolipoprotein diacylglyceryl transferase [Planctomycetota bacterium]
MVGRGIIVGEVVLDVSHLSYAAAFFLLWWTFRRELRRKGIQSPLTRARGFRRPVRTTLAGAALLLGALAWIAATRLGRAVEQFGVLEVFQHPAAAWLHADGTNGFPGMLAALATVALVARLGGWRPLAVLDALAPGLALAYAVGRIGCLVAGHCYGLPTSLPWGVRDPLGWFPYNRVHPTPAYEALAAGSLFLTLWIRRGKPRAGGVLFGWFLWGLGMERLLVEIVRRNPRGFLGLTQAQVLAAAMILAGMALVWKKPKPAGVRGASRPTPGLPPGSQASPRAGPRRLP